MKPKQRRTSQGYSILNYISEESWGGIILILVTLMAIIWANSGWYSSYHALWHELKFGFSFGKFELKNSLQHWINDGLMAVFFFTVGLEIKREVLAGELSSLKKASLPIMAAVGGMIFPAIIFAIININNPEYRNGWGIPMATDIAFVLGILSLLGKKVPVTLKIFLTALAIADDLGAILVIALFYTETINYSDLLNGAFFLIVLMVANRMGIRRTAFYAIVGFTGVWLSFLYSGIHATIAGVLIALTIPVRTKISESTYIDRLTDLLDRFKKAKPNDVSLLTAKQAHLVSDIERLSVDATTPLQKLEHALHPITAYFILPVFALANAGIHMEGSFIDLVLHPISLGIIAGLLIGKFVGISLLCKLAVWLKLAELPEGTSWRHIYGAGFLAGIGFTMSIFIASLAFLDEQFVQIAKAGIFVASFLAAIIGLTILSVQSKNI
jgi:NhaA family Na+:H+ antiporter